MLTKLLLQLHTLASAAKSKAPTLIGSSREMDRLREQIGQYADTPFPVLIEGESGSGKEVVVAELHALSRRRDKPMLALNCAAIAPTLVEPTLFGYAKGAFTGANTAQSGYFEDAGDGMLFLDEIGELPLELQAKLLRVLENGEYQRVGETSTRRSKARIVAATNRKLKQEVAAGCFRNDLYHRLSVFTLTIPPLSQRGDDRLELLDYFRTLYARQAERPPFTLDAASERRWLAYSFPGNVRELRNIVIRLVARYSGGTIGLNELEAELTPETPDDSNDRTPSPAFPRSLPAAIALARDRLATDEPFDLDAAMRIWERGFIDAALELSAGNVSQAARRLGISRTTLYHRMGTHDS
jgi:two-component system nitrogen regulation response regulator GlnG